MATFTNTVSVSSVAPENTVNSTTIIINRAPDIRTLSVNRDNLLVTIDDLGPTSQLEDKITEYMG
jgi:hypothetical protein